jgi:hypothetical protein
VIRRSRSVKRGLLALAVGAGLQVMAALMEEDVTAACGPRGKHDKRYITRELYRTLTSAMRPTAAAPTSP